MPIETMLFPKINEEAVLKAFDEELGVDYEVDYDDKTGDFMVTVFEIETGKEFKLIRDIEARFCAYSME